MTAQKVAPHLKPNTYWKVVEAPDDIYLIKLTSKSKVEGSKVTKVEVWTGDMEDLKFWFRADDWYSFFIYDRTSEWRDIPQIWTPLTKDQFEVLLKLYPAES